MYSLSFPGNIETVTITIDPFVIRDIDWDSQKSVLGYQTAGMYQKVLRRHMRH